MAGSLTFGPMTGHGAVAVVIVVVIGDIRKLATETIQVRLCCIFVSLVPPSNLQNVITRYQLNVAQRTTVLITLIKSAREVFMLRAGRFSDSEGAGED